MDNWFGNMGNLMKQAHQLQSQMKKLQEELAEKTVEVSSGGGMVTVKANGQPHILSIKIDPEIVAQNDLEMLQDLIVAAINEALRQSKEMIQSEMGNLTSEFNIPGQL